MSKDEDGLNLVWLDIEYTNEENLNLSRIMQIAMLITDANLRPLYPNGDSEGISRWVKTTGDDRCKASIWVRANQSKSLDQAETQGNEPHAVEVELYEYLTSKCPGASRDPDRRSDNPILAGQTVHMDYFHLLQQMPDLASLLNFRTLDNRTLQEAAKRWSPVEKFPPKPEKKKPPLEHFERLAHELPGGEGYEYPDAGRLQTLGGNHDALFDVYRGIATLAYYRRHLLRTASDAPFQ